jgi:hypothetical protein
MTETVFEIRQPLLYPNPLNPLNGGNFYAGYYLSQDVTQAQLKIFSASFRLVKKIQLSGNDSAGEKVKTIQASDFNIFGSGAYYYLIEATGAGSKKARAKASVLLILK